MRIYLKLSSNQKIIPFNYQELLGVITNGLKVMNITEKPANFLFHGFRIQESAKPESI